MYCSTPKDPEPLASETESPGVNSSLSRKRVPTSKWATLGVRLHVNGLVLVDEGVSTLLSGLPNGVSKSLDFRLVDFRLVGDIAAPEIGLGHSDGVDLVAMEVASPDGLCKLILMLNTLPTASLAQKPGSARIHSLQTSLAFSTPLFIIHSSK
jgi:hypothetical protein